MSYATSRESLIGGLRDAPVIVEIRISGTRFGLAQTAGTRIASQQERAQWRTGCSSTHGLLLVLLQGVICTQVGRGVGVLSAVSCENGSVHLRSQSSHVQYNLLQHTESRSSHLCVSPAPEYAGNTENMFSQSLRRLSRYLGYIHPSGSPLYTLTLAERFCVLAGPLP